MLIEVIKTGDTVSVRLSTGEELVARLKTDELFGQGFIEVERPLIVARGPEGFGLIPYMLTGSSEKVKISSAHVMSMVKTNEEITKGYSNQVSDILV